MFKKWFIVKDGVDVEFTGLEAKDDKSKDDKGVKGTNIDGTKISGKIDVKK